VLFGFLVFTAYLGFTASQVVDIDFLRETPSGVAVSAGIGPALAGTLWLLLLTAVLALPIGIGTAIYLAEYAPRTRLTAVIESVAANLAGIPSVIYGIVGLALFVRALGMGPTMLAGGCTLAVLALPVVIVSCRTAIRRVPEGLRLAAYGLGATRWQVVRNQILPAAGPEILADCPDITHFVAGLGTAGTLMGVGRYLKENKADVRIYAVEPPAGEKVEGLRSLDDGYIPPVYENWGGNELLDGKRIVRTREALEYTRRLATETSVFAGISSGAALAGACRVAERIDAGVIVFVAADGGWKYLSTRAWTDPIDDVVARADRIIYF